MSKVIYRTEQVTSSFPIQCRACVDDGKRDFLTVSDFSHPPLGRSVAKGRANLENEIMFYGLIMKNSSSDCVACMEVSHYEWNIKKHFYVSLWEINSSCTEIFVADCDEIKDFHNKSSMVYPRTSKIAHNALMNIKADMVVYHSVQISSGLEKEVCTVIKPSFVEKHMNLFGAYEMSFEFPSNRNWVFLKPIYHKFSKVINGKFDWQVCPAEWQNNPFDSKNHPLSLILKSP